MGKKIDKTSRKGFIKSVAKDVIKGLSEKDKEYMRENGLENIYGDRNFRVKIPELFKGIADISAPSIANHNCYMFIMYRKT